MQTLIRNVNIINPFDDIKTHQNVLIEGNLIKEISSSKINTKDLVNGTLVEVDGDNGTIEIL